MSSKRHEGIDSQEFRRACGRFATGVAVAAVCDPSGTPHGLTVNSFTSVSLEPPLVLISIGHESATIDFFRAATHFGISVLTEGQRGLSDHFARRGHDRFGSVAWHAAASGAPLLDGALATFDCRIDHRIPLGDHDVVVGEVLDAHYREDERPLLYFASRYRQVG